MSVSEWEQAMLVPRERRMAIRDSRIRKGHTKAVNHDISIGQKD